MHHRYCLTVHSLLIILFFIYPICGNTPGKKNLKPQPFDANTVFSEFSLSNGNNISSWVKNDGQTSSTPSATAGCFYPRGSAWVTYRDGLIWGGQVNDVRNPSYPKLRVGGQTYRVGTTPGHILVPGTATSPPVASDANLAPVYRIRKNWQLLNINSLIVLQDAAELNGVNIGAVTNQMAQDVLDNYASDWNNWPSHLGAPLNSDGTPGIADADQVLWFVYNDLDEGAATLLYESPSIGLEVQITIWSYAEANPLGQSIFRRYRVINKSGFTIDSMYIAQWVDPDIGNHTDDYIGCNIPLQTGFAYNSSDSDSQFDPFGLSPSAVGYTLLQGPLVSASGHTGVFNFQRRPGFRNLPMAAFVYYSPGTTYLPPQIADYSGTEAWYNMLQGFTPDPENQTPYLIGSGPNTGSPTVFPLSGDPNAQASQDNDGFGNNLPPGDRLFAMSSGPFQMQPGDSQEVIYAISGGNLTPDQYTSFNDMISNVEWVRNFATSTLVGIDERPERQLPGNFTLQGNYPNPFNPSTSIVYSLSKTAQVVLQVYDVLGKEIATLVAQQQAPGEYRIPFNATDLGSGLYFYKLQVDNASDVRKMIYIK